MEELIKKAQSILARSERIVAFTGAGISTESGIPDFRSPGGLWTKFDPSIYANYHVFLEEPKYYWELEREITKMIDKALPNAAHLALVDLEKKGRLTCIITQNIDMLHQRAGSRIPIYELHGSASTAKCLQCYDIIDRNRMLEKMAAEQIPKCDACGGLIKPQVVLFEEKLPSGIIHKAEAAIQSCDCMLVIGSSLQVYPANLIPQLAKENGASILFINKDETEFDEIADVTLHANCAEILPRIIKGLK